MTPQRTILVVEDDPAIALGLCDTLEFEGFRALHAKTGGDGVARARDSAPACVILDLMLPDINGFQVCSEIRKHDARVPIIILSARGQEADKIRGLDAGADDYVTKPFSIGEVVARVRALLRRAVRNAPSERLRLGRATVDLTAQTLDCDGELSELSFYEVELLRALHERVGQPVARDELLARVWGAAPATQSRSVDNFIVKLRKKIEEHPDRPRHILTVYGTGYKLVL